MAETLSNMQELTGKLEAIVDSTRIFTDADFLDTYSTDTSYGKPKRPDVVVKVLSTEEVRKIVTLANEYCLPVVPRSSAIGFYEAAIPEQGGIVVDMSDMKKVLRIDTRNKWAMFQAGTTYGELQAALAKVGFRALNPLLPHKDKSVVTSTLEREPKLTPKHHLDETILTMEMVMPNGELFHTGSMAVSMGPPEKVPDDTHCDLCNAMGPGLDWYRLVPGSLGTYGIVTTMNVKIAPLPAQRKLLFFGFDSLQDSVEPTYHILRKLIGDECFLMNSRCLATILADTPEDIGPVSEALPAYTLILNLAAGEWYPEDKMAYQENAIKDISRTFLLKPMETIPNVADAETKLSEMLYSPWQGDTYWKFRARGASKEVFFLTQLQRAPEFEDIVNYVASENDVPISEIGVYLQPKQNGRAFHMEVSFPFDPEDADDKAKAEAVFSETSEALVGNGAFFYRIYGEWADMVYSRTGNLHETLKRIKRQLDPNKVLNPGKLNF